MYTFHHPSSQSLALIFFKNIDITKVSESCIICYQTSEAYLFIRMINAKVKTFFIDAETLSREMPLAQLDLVR